MPVQPEPDFDRTAFDDFRELQAILLTAGGQPEVAQVLLTDPTMASKFDAFSAALAKSPAHEPSRGLLQAAEAFKKQHDFGRGGDTKGASR